MTDEHRKTKKCPFCKEKILYEAIKCRFCGEFLDTIDLNEDKSVEGKIKVLGLCIGLPSELPDLKQKLSRYCQDNELFLLDTIVPKDFDNYLAYHPEVEGLLLWDFNSLSKSTKDYWFRLSQLHNKSLLTNGIIDPNFEPSSYVYTSSIFNSTQNELTWHNGKPKCPVCGSVSFSERKKFGMGKALLGAAVAGPVGLFAGVLGKRGLILTCLSCRTEFKI